MAQGADAAQINRKCSLPGVSFAPRQPRSTACRWPSVRGALAEAESSSGPRWLRMHCKAQGRRLTVRESRDWESEKLFAVTMTSHRMLAGLPDAQGQMGRGLQPFCGKMPFDPQSIYFYYLFLGGLGGGIRARDYISFLGLENISATKIWVFQAGKQSSMKIPIQFLSSCSANNTGCVRVWVLQLWGSALGATSLQAPPTAEREEDP